MFFHSLLGDANLSPSSWFLDWQWMNLLQTCGLNWWSDLSYLSYSCKYPTFCYKIESGSKTTKTGKLSIQIQWIDNLPLVCALILFSMSFTHFSLWFCIYVVCCISNQFTHWGWLIIKSKALCLFFTSLACLLYSIF